MKSTLCALAAALLFCVSTFSQSFDYETLKVKYRLSPQTPFTTDFKTISVRFHGEEYLKKYGVLPADVIASDFTFHRFQSKSEHGDLHLDVVIGLPEYLGGEIKEQTKTVDEKETRFFHFRGTVVTPISYTLRDGARNTIEQKVMYSTADHLYFVTKEMTTRSAIEQYWKDNQNVVISDMLAAFLKDNLAKTASSLKNRFDDQELEDEVLFFDINKGEKINAEFINTAYAQIKQALAKNMNVSDWDETTKNKITELLMKGTKFNADDKDQRVAFAIAHYDLAALNLYWNNPEQVKSHLRAGRRADKKNYEFDQLEKRLEIFDGRGGSDNISAANYVATYQEGADDKLPMLNSGSNANGVADFSGKVRTLDTVYAKNGDEIIGFVTAVHTMRKVGSDEIHDLDHLQIEPTNMPQKEISIASDEVVYMRHKGVIMKPLETRIAGFANPPTHLYEVVKLSTDERLGLMRTAYHESMPYNLSSMENRAYCYAFKAKGAEEYDILPVSGGARYALNLNGALRKDFEFCATIVTHANDKAYSLDESSLSALVDDYNECSR